MLSNLKGSRIDARLKEEGFFYFAPEQLIIKVDSTVDNHKGDLVVKIKDHS
jgi:outer membrane protein insertion porin family